VVRQHGYRFLWAPAERGKVNEFLLVSMYYWFILSGNAMNDFEIHPHRPCGGG
jgi:hypothetical protein